MNYRPNPTELILWDTWMYPAADGRMHLFFLANRPGGHWEWVGHAISEDMVHWMDAEPILVRRPGDTYDVGVIGTGMLFDGPGGDYMMSYTANLESTRQSIAFMHSKDLMHWEKQLEEPVLFADGRYYETDVSKAPSRAPAFRDAFVHRVVDRYEALIAAQSTHGETLARGAIARYRAKDAALEKWEAMEPLLGPDVTMLMEVPEYFQIGEKHYLLWSSHSMLGFICETPARKRAHGTFWAVADSYDGPYGCPQENLLIGAGEASVIQSYVGRTVLWKGERLLYHHLGFPSPSVALPKRIVQDAEGMIHAGYWDGVEQLHKSEIEIALQGLEIQGEHVRAGEWITAGARSVRGICRRGPSLALTGAEMPADVHVRCTIETADATRIGITFRDDGRGASKPGLALQADLRNGVWQFGKPAGQWYSMIEPIETIHEPPEAGRTYRLDVVVRDIYFEAYIDGIWKFTRVVPDHARKGRIGFYVDSGEVTFEDIRAWELTPMVNGYVKEGS